MIQPRLSADDVLYWRSAGCATRRRGDTSVAVARGSVRALLARLDANGTQECHAAGDQPVSVA